MIMSTEIFSPPRYPSVPNQPLPQTIMGVLEHSGIMASSPELVTDIPPDFGWMTVLQLFQAAVTMSKNDAPGKLLLQDPVNTLVYPEKKANKRVFHKPYWTILPLCGAKWWSGMISYKFIAIKPPRVTGKIIITYSFDPEFDQANNSKKMKVSKEWDLGESNVCEFDITGLNQIRLRPTWLPLYQNADYVTDTARFVNQALPQYSWNMGLVTLEVANYLQPGNLFPDSIRILYFKSFKACNLFQATDLRSSVPPFSIFDWD